MAKKKLDIDFKALEKLHSHEVDKYGAQIKTSFSAAIVKIAKTSSRATLRGDKPFAFSDFPKIEIEVDAVINGLVTEIEGITNEGTYKQWLASSLKNDQIADYFLNNANLSKVKLGKYYERNLDAYNAFQSRKSGGLGLSDRIWNYAGQFKEELEMAIDIGLLDGRSAAELSRDIRGYLSDKNQNRLFRRVRDARGQLQLSKHAKAYNPGQGVYRSSFKNAFRMTRNEVNMAYRSSDFERWNQLDFVIGIRVSLSGSHPVVDICDTLAGTYPKDFKFLLWHVQCLCFATPILMPEGDFIRSLSGKDVGIHYIKDMPNDFTNWVSDNTELVQGWKSVPYFIRDNFKDGNITKGLKF